MLLQSRRDFLRTATLGASVPALLVNKTCQAHAAKPVEAAMQFGLVTYLWGRDWDLPRLIKNCEQTHLLGVELRSTHAHGVEPEISAAQRSEVKKQFADSPVTCLGPGSNERFDNPDPQVVDKAIETTKSFIKLSHDIGGTGVKVKPDTFHNNVPHKQTIEQIGKSLNRLGIFAADYGQQVRLEVHGKCGELPTIKQIMEIADHPSVAICWNSNPTDLHGRGLEYNFNLVRKRFGDTLHVHEFQLKKYPYAELFRLLVQSQYEGWVLLEASSKPDDRIAALKTQRLLYAQLVNQAVKSL